jgi:hypothetical protein
VTIPTPVFQVWNEDGSSPLGTLQGVSEWAISDVFCDLGSLTLRVPLDVVGAEHLLTDADRQLRVLWQGGPDMWFVTDDDQWAGVADAPESEPRDVACRSLAAVLDEALLEDDYHFQPASPGNMIRVLYVDAIGRGYLQGVDLIGDGTADAGGHEWPDLVDVTFKAGTSLLSALKKLSEARLLEWRMNGRAVETHIPGGDLDRTLAGTVLRPGADVAAASVRRSRREIATDVLIVEDDGTVTTRSQTLPGRRKRQALVDRSEGTGSGFIGDLYLASHAASDVQLSHDLQDGEDTPVPWVDFRPGDRLPTVAAGGGVTLWRAAQVAVARRGEQATVSVELGSLLKSAEERVADKLAHIRPGAVVLS